LELVVLLLSSITKFMTSSMVSSVSSLDNLILQKQKLKICQSDFFSYLS
jgi:hypothetical protein